MADRGHRTVPLALVAMDAVTGFLSHAAYEPDLHGTRSCPWAPPSRSRSHGRRARTGSTPVNQSVHVNAGLVALPFQCLIAFYAALYAGTGFDPAGTLLDTGDV